MNGIVDNEPKKEEEEGGAKEAEEATEKIVDPEAKWEVIEEAIAKVIADVKAVINIAVMAFESYFNSNPQGTSYWS